MSDNPYADVTTNPYADTPATPVAVKKPLLSGVPMPIRDVTRSILSVPVDFARLTSYLGESAVSRWGNEANAWLDENIAPEAQFSQEPMRAALQLGGSAIVPIAGWGNLTAKAVNAVPQALKGITAGAMRGAELALIPGSSPYTKGNVALNATVGIGLGAGVEKLADAAYPERVATPQPDPTFNADVSPTITTPAAANAETNPYAELPATQGNPYAKVIVDKLPYVLLAAGALGVGAAARAGHRAGKLADAANVDGLTQPGTAIGPNAVQGVAEGIEAGVFNSLETVNYKIKEAVKANVITPERGDELSSLASINLREAINNDRVAEVLQTGKLDANYSMPNPRLWMEEVSRLTDQQHRLLNDLLPAADELDVRIENVRQGKFKSTGEPEAVSLHDKSYADLHKFVAAGRNDPAVAAIEQTYRAMNNSLLDYSVHKGIFSPEEAAAMRAKGPNYMHRVISDLTIERNKSAGMPLTQGTENNSPITARTRTEEGGPLRAQHSAFNFEDGLRQSLDFINRNEAIREIAQTLHSGNISGRQFSGIGRILPAKSGVADGFVGIKFRDKGQRLQIEVDKNIAAAVMPYPRLAVPILSNLRVLTQYATTGPVGALLGNVQAFTSAATSGITAAVTAPSKMRVGYVDAALRRLTNNRINIRQLGLIDPTFAAQIGEAFLRDLAAHAASSLGATLNRSVEKNGYIAAMIGPGKAKQIADAMTMKYYESLTHVMRREGILSQGISYASDAHPSNTNIANVAPELARRMPYGSNAPSIMGVRTQQQFNEYMALQGSRLTPVAMRRAWHFFSRTLDLLSNSPQSALYRANVKHLGHDATAGFARTVVGDPAQYGGYRGVQAATSMLTYQNIAMQAAHQVFKAIQREPIAATGRIATLGATLSLIMLHSAIDSDEERIKRGEEPKAVAHLLTRDANDAARSFRIYYGSDNPESSIRLPIDGALAPFFSAILAGFSEAFDVDNPEFFTGRYAPLRESVERILSDGNTERMKASFGVMGLDMSMPSAAQLYSRLGLGVDLRGGLNLATGPTATKVSDAPGFATTSLNNDVVDRYTSTVFETMLGLGGQTLLDLARTYGYTYRIKGADEAAKATLGQYGQTLASTGSARMFAPALGVERRLRTNDLLGDQVRKVEDKMQAILSNKGELVGGEGSVGSVRNLQTSPYGAGREGVSPDMLPLLGEMANYYTKMKPLQEARKRESDLLRDAQSSSMLRSNPTKLRETSNEHVMNIRSINATVYTLIDQLEKRLSAQTGRRVRLDTIDPTQGLDQFAPLH